MKRLVVGGLLAAIAWMIGTQSELWYMPQVGLVVGFLSGLIFADWQVTKRIACEKWKATIAWRPKWGVFGQYLLNILVVFATCFSWVLVTYTTFIVCNYNPSQELGILDIFMFPFFIFLFLTLAMMILPLFKFSNETIVDSVHSCRKDIAYPCAKYGNPFSLVGLATYGLIIYVIPFVWKNIIKNIPHALKVSCKAIKKFSIFLLYTLTELIAREKTLAFAICVTVGAGFGMYMGKTILCGLIAAVTASWMIWISDRLREFAQEKLDKLRELGPSI